MSLRFKIQHTALVTWMPLSHFCAAGSYCTLVISRCFLQRAVLPQ